MTLRRLATVLTVAAALTALAAPASAGELYDEYCVKTPVIELCTPPLPV